MPALKRQPIAQPRKITPAGLRTAADKFVTGRTKDEDESTEPVKRMTIIISDSLHRRIKVDCASRGISMLDAVRDALERRWPAEAA